MLKSHWSTETMRKEAQSSHSVLYPTAGPGVPEVKLLISVLFFLFFFVNSVAAGELLKAQIRSDTEHLWSDRSGLIDS